MRLTRPQRRRILLPAWIVLWAIVAAVLWLPSETTFIAYGVREWKLDLSLGLLTYLVVERETTAPGGTIEALWIDDGGKVRWYWHHSNFFLTVFATTALTGLCWVGYRWSLARRRLEGRCDECGYDLKGLRGHVCPECGKERQGAEGKVEGGP